MSETRRFKILVNYGERRLHLDWPETVPWGLVAPHEAQAKANHGQSLETLNQRGGLSPIELLAVLEDREYRVTDDADAAITEIMRLGGITRK